MRKKGFLKGVFKGVFKGAVKSLPFGNIITEVIENVTTNQGNEVLRGAISDESVKNIDKITFYVSLTIQLICVTGIVYSFLTKQITIEELLNYLNYSKNVTT